MTIKIALTGNPNSGKTTLFNALTGSNQFVGNWPGVTVEKKEGPYKNNKDIIITDLPGIYSLSPYTLEEVVARNYLLNEKPNAILNMIDGTNLERNLYLTTQLLELGIPIVLAINMMDIVEKNGDKININCLSKSLGCTVVEISALKATGITTAIEAAIHAAKENQKHSSLHNFSGSVEHAIAHIEEAVLHDFPEETQRWYAIKLFERDPKIQDLLHLSEQMRNHIENDILSCEEELDDDAESIITNERYNYVASVIKDCYVKKSLRRQSTTDKIDRIVTNRFLALPIFVLIMFFVYFVSVSAIGGIATKWTSDGLFGDGWHCFGIWLPGIPVIVEHFLTAIHCADWLQDLILNGILAGVGSVLSFVPQMLILFFLLAFLEACGYMSRIAFILDKIFHKFGLSGKSFIPILIGTGCGVPGIMASRTIENPRDRKMTIITTTFIPCGAKLPVIALISGAMFGGAWWVAPSAYFAGICAIIISGIILKKTRLFAGEDTPFLMELPTYHMPTLINLLHSMWERGWSFIKKAGTVILLASILIWFASNYGWKNGTFGAVSMEYSLLACLGNLFAPLFAPLGWGNWQSTVAVITGLAAKENIVSTLSVLVGNLNGAAENSLQIWENMRLLFSPLAAYSFLIFNLLCAPCCAAMAAIRKEMNSGKWTAFAIGYQCIFAYAVSLMIYQFGLFFSGNGFTVWTIFASAIFIFFCFMLLRPQKEHASVAKALKNQSRL